VPFTPLKDDLADVAGCAEVLQGLWCLGQRKHLVYGCDRASLERGPGTPCRRHHSAATEELSTAAPVSLLVMPPNSRRMV
jgi:hypothetical protein